MIYLIEPDHIRYGAKSNPNIQTHLQVVKSRLEAQRLANFYDPFYIENTAELKGALLATIIRLVIRSVSQSEGKLTRHARRFFQYFPHRQHNVRRDESVSLAGHLGSLGYVSVKYGLQGEPIQVVQQLLDLFWRDHGLSNASLKIPALLKQLCFYEHESYFDVLETKLVEAARLEHPLLIRSGLTEASVSSLKYRLLFGEFDHNLIQVIEYFQSISNRFGGGLPRYDPETALQFVRSTLSIGYTAGLLLAFQAQAVQSLLEAYKTADGLILSDVTQPYKLAELFAQVSDAFTSMAMFNFEYAASYAQSYHKMAQAWLLQSGKPSILLEGRVGFGIKEITLQVEPGLTYRPASPVRTREAVILLAADQYITSQFMTFTITLLSATVSSAAITLESSGDASFIPERRVLKANKPEKITVEIAEAGYGSARAVGQELMSNSLLFENIPLDFKP